jgi:hypothetical protein
LVYPILIELFPKAYPALLVEDGLPEGLEYVSSEIITQAVLSGGLLAEDFSGSVLSPTITAPGGSGGDVTFSFGDVDCTIDTGTPLLITNTFLFNTYWRA